MGGEQAASVLAAVHRSLTPKMRLSKPIRQRYEDEGNPLFRDGAPRDDGVIDPRNARRPGLALAVTLNARDSRTPAFWCSDDGL